MANIEEATGVVTEFIRRMLSSADTRPIKFQRTAEGWEAEIEVYEESSFIKSVGLPTRVKDRNIYKVKVDDNLDVLSYERKHPGQPQE